MGIPVLIMGESGSGKSCSLRNFDKSEVVIYNIAGKPLPFRNQLNKADNVSYAQIANNMIKKSYKTYVIDDSQYLMAFEMFDRAKESGYNKFTDVALNFRNLVDMSHQRLCTRAYWEYRQLFRDIIEALENYSDEWKILVQMMKPKCEVYGYCTEEKSCGRVLKKESKNINL